MNGPSSRQVAQGKAFIRRDLSKEELKNLCKFREKRIGQFDREIKRLQERRAADNEELERCQSMIKALEDGVDLSS